MHTELRLRTADGTASFSAHDTVCLLPDTPPDGEAMLRTPYRSADHVVAYSRRQGSGRFVYIGLGRNPASYVTPEVQRLVIEALRQPASHNATLGVGMLGFGALGPAHAEVISMTAGLALRAVCDTSAARRCAAEALGVRSVEDAAELWQAEDVDIVLVGTPPVTHAAAVMGALRAGKHVVCEKPFALHACDCDSAIALATARGRMLTVFQNRRWDPDFVRVRDLIRSGAIGDVFHIETFVGGYSHPCNFWHSDERVSGGLLFDWGSHYIDWILQLVDARVRAVRAMQQKRVWHDVTNADHAWVEIDFDNGAHATFTHSDLAAARKPKWYVLGSAGAIVGDWRHQVMAARAIDGEVEETQVLPTDLPAQVSVHRPRDGGVDVETVALPRRDRFAFWRNVTAHLRDGTPLAVTAGEARRTVAVLEAAAHSAAHSATLMPIDD